LFNKGKSPVDASHSLYRFKNIIESLGVVESNAVPAQLRGMLESKGDKNGWMNWC